MQRRTVGIDRLILPALFAFVAGGFACTGMQTPAGPSGAVSTPGGGGSGPGGSGGSGGGGTTTGMGSLAIRLTDSPFSEAKAVLVTFSEVSVHRSETGWETLPFAGGASTRTCDLKKLVGATDVLGVGPLLAGHYQQIRLTVESAAIYFDNASTGAACAPTIAAPAGIHAPVEVSSGTLKLNREFTLASGGATTILLDFDGDKSIKHVGGGNGGGNGNGRGNGRGNGNGGGSADQTGRYIMTPVIGVVSVQ